MYWAEVAQLFMAAIHWPFSRWLWSRRRGLVAPLPDGGTRGPCSTAFRSRCCPARCWTLHTRETNPLLTHSQGSTLKLLRKIFLILGRSLTISGKHKPDIILLYCISWL